MSTTTTSWLVPVRHPSPDDLELWLERKAAQGQLLREFDAFSPMRMRFERTEPSTVRFALERRASPVPTDYYSVREDLGWTHVGRLSDIHVWRRAYTGERPAGFIGTDLGRRAALYSVGFAVVAVVAFILAAALGLAAAFVDVGLAAQDFWIPAAVIGAIGVASGVTALALHRSRRSAATAAPAAAPARETVDA